MSNNAVDKSNAFLKAIKERRTYYGLSKGTVITNERIQEIVNEAVKHTPSAFNSQSARVVVLFGDQSDKLWSITKETLRKSYLQAALRQQKKELMVSVMVPALFFSSKIKLLWKVFKLSSQPMQTTSRFGPTNLQACCSSSSGRRLSKKDLEHPCSTTTR